jgi:excisionase family DNA binding protein
MSRRLLTARAVGDLLGVHPETVLRWTRRGELPAVRLPGGAIRYREAEFQEWLEERATAQTRSCQPPRRPPPGGRLVLSATPEDEEV